VCGVRTDTGVAQQRGLFHVPVQRHVILLSSQGEFCNQQGVQAIIRERPLGDFGRRRNGFARDIVVLYGCLGRTAGEQRIDKSDGEES